MADPRVEVVGQLSEDEVRAVSELVEAATEADGVRPLSEHVMLHLRYGGDAPVRNVLIYGRDSEPSGDTRPDDAAFANRLAAYGHLDVTDGSPRPPPRSSYTHLPVIGDWADCWSRRPSPRPLMAGCASGRTASTPARRARRARWASHSPASLWQMRRSLYAALPEPQLARRGFRPHVRVGARRRRVGRLNALAFRGHPEQGGWVADDLHRRMREPWFDPAGFFLATRPEAPTGRSASWASTGRRCTAAQEHHGDTGPHTHDGHGHDLIGEVYVVGVDPTERGTGLGRALTLIGLRYLRHRGLPDAMLYVDADNAAAIALYRGLDFTRWETDVMFSRDTS